MSTKYRPSSLNLDTKSNVAVRIVSPGLPPLSNKMISTVKLSQKIEQQQRNIIASRNSSGGSVSNQMAGTTPGENTVGSGPSSSANSSFSLSNSSSSGIPVQIPTQDVDDEMDRLVSPRSCKRLKRENVPTPLSFNGCSAPSNASRPSIQSAPTRSVRSSYPQTSHHLQHSQSQQTAQLSNAQYQPMWSTKRRTYPPATMTPASAGGGNAMYYVPASYQRRVRPSGIIPQNSIPATSTNQYYIQQQQIPPVPSAGPIYAQSSPYKKRIITGTPQNSFCIRQTAPVPTSANQAYYYPVSSTPVHSRQPVRSVTDVYHGSYTRAAPINAQPLSAQYEYFDRTEEDRIPASEEEILEMQRKYEDMDEDPESAAIDEFDEKQAKSQWKGEIFGSINLLNESVFNFRIFVKDDDDAEMELEEPQIKGESLPNSRARAEADVEVGAEAKAIQGKEAKPEIEAKSEIEAKPKAEFKPEAEAEEQLQSNETRDIDQLKTDKNDQCKDGETNVLEAESENKSQDNKLKSNQKDDKHIHYSHKPKRHWLDKEKAKFMKICETSWDEFISSRMQT